MALSRDAKTSASRFAYRVAAGTLAVLGLKAAVRTHVLPRLLSAAQSGEAANSATSAVEKFIEKEIARAVATPGPILVGPWLSEVGFELLYWIPMLRWMKEKWQIPEDRLVIVSRGGTQLWYQGVCGRYVDILDLTGPEEFKRLNQTRWDRDQGQKQAFIEDQDREVIGWVKTATGIEAEAVIHPSMMYAMFWSVFQRRAPLDDLLQRVRFLPQTRPVLTEDLKAALPEKYVALRFYFRTSFPDNKHTRAFASYIVRRISRYSPVVLLNTGLQLDDHTDWAGKNVITVDHLMTPSTNLDIQTRLIANAQAFVGTYGGLSYLAPLLGLPAIGFYSDDSTLMHTHIETARAACRKLDSKLLILHTDDVAAIEDILGAPP